MYGSNPTQKYIAVTSGASAVQVGVQFISSTLLRLVKEVFFLATFAEMTSKMIWAWRMVHHGGDQKILPGKNGLELLCTIYGPNITSDKITVIARILSVKFSQVIGWILP
jgi:hypothetical protein